MRCKDIERLMIDDTERQLSLDETTVIVQHVSECSSCSKFQEDLLRMRNGLKTIPGPLPAEELIQRTRTRCHAEMETLSASGSGIIHKVRSKPVPKVIWIAVFTLVVLTGVFVISLFPEFSIEETVSLKTILAVTLIVQNAAMLFFAPVLIQKFRWRTNDFGLNGHENFI